MASPSRPCLSGSSRLSHFDWARGTSTLPFGEGNIADLVYFVGNPVIALFIGVALAFQLKDKKVKETHSHWVGEGLKQAGVIILITGAGGAFGGHIASNRDR